VNDLFGIQTHVAPAIVDHHEIIACAIHLCETQHGTIILAAALSLVIFSECVSTA
jgi:hypothetical protein